MTIIETERLVLREWQNEDLLAFSRINKDPKVLEFLPAPLTAQELLIGSKGYNSILKSMATACMLQH